MTARDRMELDRIEYDPRRQQRWINRFCQETPGWGYVEMYVPFFRRVRMTEAMARDRGWCPRLLATQFAGNNDYVTLRVDVTNSGLAQHFEEWEDTYPDDRLEDMLVEGDGVTIRDRNWPERQFQWQRRDRSRYYTLSYQARYFYNGGVWRARVPGEPDYWYYQDYIMTEDDRNTVSWEPVKEEWVSVRYAPMGDDEP